jgi:hypothetical protein
MSVASESSSCDFAVSFVAAISRPNDSRRSVVWNAASSDCAVRYFSTWARFCSYESPASFIVTARWSCDSWACFAFSTTCSSPTARPPAPIIPATRSFAPSRTWCIDFSSATFCFSSSFDDCSLSRIAFLYDDGSPMIRTRTSFATA